MACPICNWDLISRPSEADGNTRFGCPRCGNFSLARSALDDLPQLLETDRERAVLSYSVRRAQKASEDPTYSSESIKHIIDSAYLPGAHEQADNLVRWLGDNSDGPGVYTGLNSRDHGAIAGSLLNNESFRFLAIEMIKSGLLEGKLQHWKVHRAGGGTLSQADGLANATLSFNGWQRYEELKRGAASGSAAFMAMQYLDPQLDDIVNNHFRPAVQQTGFELRRLDDQPKAGLIDDRLRVEIKACRFLIADLSHGNRGAHWEAGYAEGLGKPVIYTCRQDVFGNPNHEHHPHFDTNHHLTVIWDPNEIDEACQRLKETIRATLPDAHQHG